MVLRRAGGRRLGPGAERALPLALWVSATSEVGGVARHVLDVADAGVPGWRLAVLCPEGPLAEELRRRGHAVAVGPVGAADGMARAVGAVRRAVARLRPDLVHSHLAFADLVVLAATVGTRRPDGRRLARVSTEHGIAGVPGLYNAGRARARMMAAAHRPRLARTDQVIAVSASTREQVLAQWGDGAPITVVRHGIEPGDHPDPRPGLRVLSLSRLSPEKRIDAVITAFSQVHGEHPEATLTIAGDGVPRAELESQVRREGLAGAVTFGGTVDARTALAEHDVVVQLSRWENLSYTVLDACAAGLGVVATPVGGNPEILPPQCLVDAVDTAAVAGAIVRQGLDLPQRPPTGSVGGSVARMTAAIAAVYARTGAGA